MIYRCQSRGVAVNRGHVQNAQLLSGAQAKHVPEVFLAEAVNALNGWSEDWEFGDTSGDPKNSIRRSNS